MRGHITKRYASWYVVPEVGQDTDVETGAKKRKQNWIRSGKLF